MGEIITEREQMQQDCQAAWQGVYILEKALLNYFVDNEERVLALQKSYLESGQNIGVIAATEHAIAQDICSPEFEAQQRVLGVINGLQFVLAQKKAYEKCGQGDEAAVLKEMGSISEIFRPEPMRYFGLVRFVMEDYSGPTFKKIFEDIVDRAA